jgi:hypothetical protein
MTMSNSEALVKAAHARRKELLAQVRWLDTPTVSVRQGGSAAESESSAIVRNLRQGNALFGVWSGVEYLHPAFQFDPATGVLLSQMRELLELMPQKLTEWQQCFWFFQAHAVLAGECPAAVFAQDPSAVLAAARSSFKTALAA